MKTNIAKVFLAAVVLSCAAVLSIAADGAPNTQPAPVYSWQEPHAKVLPNGGLEWAPKPFVFEKSEPVRYIDFENGRDELDGKTPQTAWKHHPWDANATALAKASKGVRTYIFKGGIVYRGVLVAAESGTPDNPIRLTSDPAWGNGPAAFYGSTQIKRGWRRASPEEAPGIPHPEKVWFIDLGKAYDPDPPGAKFSAMWQVVGNNVERLHIARFPDYDLSDPDNPVKNWPTWNTYDKKTGTFSSLVLKNAGDKSLLNGAAIWMEGAFLMGAATRILIPPNCYDPYTGAITIRARANDKWYPSIPRTAVHFMIENVAKFLDSPGEYFFAENGSKAGRLFLWPAGNVDPNSATYEVAQTRFLLQMTDKHDIVISGLEFRYNDPDKATGDIEIFYASPCIRIVGNSSNITVKNCRFYYVANAIMACPRLRFEGGPTSDILDNIIVSDNEICHAERSHTIYISGGSENVVGAPYGRLIHAEIMRNHVMDTGFRHGAAPWSSIPAIYMSYPETCEIAGNIVDTSFGNGIITFGGKGSGTHNVVPLTRMLVHHNQIDNSMLGCNDYGGLEHFQGGPIYLYNNITRNCVGNRTLGSELGYSLYLDGGFKCYVFNNIIAGKVKPAEPDYYNNCGYFMVFGFMDQLFNNTIYHFKNALDGSSGNRSNILGNLMVDCKLSFIGQNRPGDVSMLGGGDTGAMGRSGIPTMAYASNVFFGNPTVFGRIGGISTVGAGKGAPVLTGTTLNDLRAQLEGEKCRLASIGWQVPGIPLAAPAMKDYRLVANSGAKGRGVKYFVPWALARTVGEWNFFKSESNPQVVLGESFYMTDEYIDRGMYYFIPRNDLTVSNCTAKDYVPGPLEDWIDGALTFDGKTRIASLAHAEMTKNMNYAGGPKSAANTYDGSRRETLDMGANSFLIEIVFKTDPGHVNGILASKSARSGYALTISPNGGACMTLQAGAASTSAVSMGKVNDGRWHHVLAETDRVAGKIKIYIDGKPDGEAQLDAVTKNAPLSNTADFIVGKGLVGAVDFLRVCRSTLAESKTTINELYTWEFGGPFLLDFAGKPPIGGKRDAGAICGEIGAVQPSITNSAVNKPVAPASVAR